MNKMKAFRQDLHQIPEVCLEEFKTQKYLITALQDMGYTTFSLLETDVLVYIDNGHQETIAFRSDIDALEVTEENDIDFKSTHEGFMHACGHDGHMAMLLGFADYLKDKKNMLQKNILLIFQPAEESIGGARLLCEKNLLEDYHVKAIFGIHLFPDIPQGTLASKANEFMAKASEVTIKIHGKSAHGAMPQFGIDSNLILSKLLLDFQSIQTRNISPVEHSIITFGRIEGGTVRNVVSDYAVMEGTIRTFSTESFTTIIDRMTAICKGYEQAYNCTIDFKYTDGYLPVINNESLYKTFKRAITGIPYHEFKKPLMIAEDFSFYQDRVPGVFFYVGTRNEELGYINSLHNSRFNFDELALDLGLEAYLRILKEMGVLDE